ncbi:MAG: hypothetical protein A2W29_12690 [Gemmatimonadetes bacterium RBG_16_66_8]|nr:MAG: hypothetical protein A2W29_12690 [Gemmatimonadetes bacterium RBG_16_66_8]
MNLEHESAAFLGVPRACIDIQIVPRFPLGLSWFMGAWAQVPYAWAGKPLPRWIIDQLFSFRVVEK